MRCAKVLDQETLKTFNNLYDETYQNVLTYVICNCSNIEDVKDIVQNIYLALFKKLKKKKGSISNAYILGIAKNKVKEYYRFKYKTKLTTFFSNKNDIDPSLNIPDDFNLQEDFIKKEDIASIWKFLKKKKIIITQIFYLYYYLDLPIKDIAAKLHISVSNVKNYLYRTLKELKVYLDKEV